VIELQDGGLVASAAARIDKCATPAIALIDLAFDRVGDVARRLGSVSRPLAGHPSHGEALLLHFIDQQLESLTDDRRQIPVRDPVAKQALGLSKLVANGAAGGELDLVSLLAERRDERTSFAAVRAMLHTVRR
jgi:hypothetical protein